MALITRCLNCVRRTEGSRCATCRRRHDDWQARRKMPTASAAAALTDLSVGRVIRIRCPRASEVGREDRGLADPSTCGTAARGAASFLRDATRTPSQRAAQTRRA